MKTIEIVTCQGVTRRGEDDSGAPSGVTSRGYGCGESWIRRDRGGRERLPRGAAVDLPTNRGRCRRLVGRRASL